MLIHPSDLRRLIAPFKVAMVPVVTNTAPPGVIVNDSPTVSGANASPAASAVVPMDISVRQ